MGEVRDGVSPMAGKSVLQGERAILIDAFGLASWSRAENPAETTTVWRAVPGGDRWERMEDSSTDNRRDSCCEGRLENLELELPEEEKALGVGGKWSEQVI